MQNVTLCRKPIGWTSAWPVLLEIRGPALTEIDSPHLRRRHYPLKRTARCKHANLLTREVTAGGSAEAHAPQSRLSISGHWRPSLRRLPVGVPHSHDRYQPRDIEHSVHHEQEVREFLSCGVLNHGFTRALIPAPTEGALVARVVRMLMLPSYALEGVATSRPFLVTAVHDHDVREAPIVRRHRGVEALRSGGPAAVEGVRSAGSRSG